MQTFKRIGIRTSTLVMETGIFMLSFLGVAYAQPLQEGADAAREPSLPSDLPNVFRTVANILIFLIGAVSVIMLIIGGFRYVVSGGDSNAVEGAKNTILYAIVGIVVAFLSFAAVNFVISRLQTAG